VMVSSRDMVGAALVLDSESVRDFDRVRDLERGLASVAPLEALLDAPLDALLEPDFDRLLLLEALLSLDS